MGPTTKPQGSQTPSAITGNRGCPWTFPSQPLQALVLQTQQPVEEYVEGWLCWGSDYRTISTAPHSRPVDLVVHAQRLWAVPALTAPATVTASPPAGPASWHVWREDPFRARTSPAKVTHSRLPVQSTGPGGSGLVGSRWGPDVPRGLRSPGQQCTEVASAIST